MGQNTLNGCDVLLLEDEPLVMLDIKSSLEEAGARVHCAGRVSEGKAILASKKVSAAVIDYLLSDGNADDLCEDLKARGIPFALYSGYRGVDGNCARGEVLPKPACSDELVSMVLKMFSEKGVHVPSGCVMR